nr:N-acetylmuramoyl-L-alanine amidase [uncultured Desulfobulbus sp.]
MNLNKSLVMHAVNQRISVRRCSPLLYLLIVCLWFCLPPNPLCARTTVTHHLAIKEQAGLISPQVRYETNKANLTKLLTNTPANKNRSNWLIIAGVFGDLAKQEHKGELGPSSLFMQARTYQIMYDRFHLEEDAKSARKIYLQLADLYPGSTLSDDALYKAALLGENAGEKLPSAKSLLEKLVLQYPQSDYAHLAQQQLKEPQREQPSPTPPPSTTEPSHPTPSIAKGTPPVNYSQVGQSKFWISERYSRVVISAVPQTPYIVQQKNNSLVVDFKNSTIDPQFCRVQQFDQGLLQRVETDHPQAGTVHLQFDFHALTDYKVFTLNDPFRVILDVYGAESAASPSPLAAPSTTSAPAKQIETLPPPTLSDHKKRAISGQSPRIKRQQERLSLAQQLGLGVKTIVIDPGHGGKDPGAMAFGLKEKDITLGIAKKLARLLTTTHHYQVVLTRSKDVYIPLEKRTAMANAKKADLFISIHVNAHPDTAQNGIETYFLNLATDADAMRVAALENASSTHSIGELQDILNSLMNNSKIDESSRLARFVQTNLINGLTKPYKPRDLGVKQAPFYVLIGAEMPAILAELSFITNGKEAALLKNDAHLEKLAQKLADGIVAYIDHHRAGVRMY